MAVCREAQYADRTDSSVCSYHFRAFWSMSPSIDQFWRNCLQAVVLGTLAFPHPLATAQPEFSVNYSRHTHQVQDPMQPLAPLVLLHLSQQEMGRKQIIIQQV